MKPDLEKKADQLIRECNARKKRVQSTCISSSGEFTVLGVDKFERTDWVEARRESKKAALQYARQMTDEAKKRATDKKSATVYLAYDPDGHYIGGDTWEDE